MEHRVRSQESGARIQNECERAILPSSASNLKPQTSNDAKPLASISLDLDNKWSYMKTHGDPGWESFPSYFDIFIPQVLDLLDRFSLQITFFIVGQDALLDKNREFLKLLTDRGHEVGNHSFNHEPWLHLYPIDRIRKEIQETEEQIYQATGQKPLGFRGPGFSWSPDLIQVLTESGYLFDASTLPTYLGPLARAYYFWTSDLNDEEKEQRKLLFGSFKEGRKPVKPYFWELSNGSRILEMPVTTFPVLKIPFHLSYLLYLSRFSARLMLVYLKLVLMSCRLTRTEPSFLLHPLDFLDGHQTPELAFFPGMDLQQTRKLQLFEKILGEFRKHYTLTNMTFHAKSISESINIPRRTVELDSIFKHRRVLTP